MYKLPFLIFSLTFKKYFEIIKYFFLKNYIYILN